MNLCSRRCPRMGIQTLHYHQVWNVGKHCCTFPAFATFLIVFWQAVSSIGPRSGQILLVDYRCMMSKTSVAPKESSVRRFMTV